MIKPASLWSFLKETKDPDLVRRICMTLGGHEVSPPLNVAEMALYKMIQQDSEWMDERVEAQRGRWRERQAKHRKKVAEGGEEREESPNVTQSHGDNVIVTQSHDTSVRPSVRPSIHPTPKGVSDNTRALADEDSFLAQKVNTSPESQGSKQPPTLEMVLAVANEGAQRSGGEVIPSDFARDWFSLMEASGWRDTKGNRIVANGWRAKLAFAWRDEKARRKSEAEKAHKQTKGSRNELYTEDDLAESVGL